MRPVFAFFRLLSGNRRLPAWTVGILLAGIVALAAWQRFSWPAYPLADSDTWGYLHPALSKLTGGPFEHTYGRNFVYPAWVYLSLRSCGDFRVLTIAQHALGLAAGLLLWAGWRRWRAFLPGSALPAWAEAALGLGLAAFFLLSPSVILYEHQIRPEAVFPFFAALDVWLLLGFCRAWFVQRRTGAGAAWGAAAWFGGVLLYQFKPSFGLTILVVAAPLLAGGVLAHGGNGAAAGGGRRRAWRARLALGGALAAASLLAAGVFVWPERRLARADPLATLFLPETLLTIHADIIRDQMRADLAAGASTPFPAPWLAATYAAFVADIGYASQPILRPYRSLGFNPDRLMYDDASFCGTLTAQERDPARVAAFAFYYYRRAWEQRPLPMLGKIVRQLHVFYRLHCPAYWPAGKFKLRVLYHRGLVALRYDNYQEQMARCAPARTYLAAAAELARTGGTVRPTPFMVNASVLAGLGYVPLLALFLAGLGAAALARAGLIDAPGLAGLWGAGLLVLGFYALNFGNCLTISIVHSLDIDRYSYNQLVYSALAEFSALAWLSAAGLRLARRTPAPAPVNAAAD